MPTHKFLPGRPVALEALLDQLGILLQASSVLKSRYLLRQDPQAGLLGLHTMERKMPHLCSPAFLWVERTFCPHLTHTTTSTQDIVTKLFSLA
jgi:hypothetical protein